MRTVFLLALACLAGCSGPIGQRISDRAEGGTVENGSPNSLIGQDGESSGTVNSTGPVRELVIGPTGVRTRQGGANPSEGVIRSDDQSMQFAWSVAANIGGKGIKVYDRTGQVLFEAAELTVDGAAQIDALNRSLDRLAGYWAERDRLTVEQSKVVKDTIAEIAKSLPSLASILAQAFGVGG